MDALEKRLKNDENIDEKQINAFKQYIDAEEFDSDAVIADIQDLDSVNDVENSNIFQATTDKRTHKSLYDYIKQIQCMSIHIKRLSNINYII